MLCQGRVIEADSVAEGYPAIGIRYLEIVLRSVEYFVVDRFTTGSIYTIETHALNNTGIRDKEIIKNKQRRCNKITRQGRM